MCRKVRHFVRNVIRNPFFRPYPVRISKWYSRHRARALHCIGNFHTGGSARLVVDLIERLGDTYEQEIITRHLPELPHYRGLTITPYQEKEADKIRSYIQTFQPAFLHVHYWGTIDYQWYRLIFEIAEGLKLPVIENINIPIKPYVSSAVYQYVYVSNFVKDHYSEGDGRGVVIYPGTDFNFFNKKNPAEPFSPCVGMVYRLEQDKLNEHSIDVFLKVARRNRKVTCLIIGNGYYYDVFKERVRKEGLGKQFRFTGYVGYGCLPYFYKKMTMFVAPVHSESFGHVIPIAMGMGMPVAGYHVGALEEIISDASLLAPPGNTDVLAGIINNVLNDKPRRLEISRYNRERALRLFSIETMVKRYKDLYGQCMA